jgi:hypothetical protein
VVEDDSRDVEEGVRRLQVRLNADAGSRNVVRTGANRVTVFVGATDLGTLLGAIVANEQLRFEAEEETVTVTVELIPQLPPGEPVRAPLVIPRARRSDSADLPWHIPTGRRRFPVPGLPAS